MNTAILTGFTKTILWNNYGKCDFGRFASEVNLRYACKNNYAFICEILDNLQDRQDTWIKIWLLRKYIEQFDYIVWIDADAIFLKNLNVESFISKDIDLVLSRSLPDNNNIVHTLISTGFMIWKNSFWSKTILKFLWNNSERYAYEFFHEQSLMDAVIRQDAKKHNIELLSSSTDLIDDMVINNVKIIPYRYHSMSIDTKFIFHAAADTPTKYRRLINAYNSGYCGTWIK